MGSILRNWRVTGATLFSIALIVSAYAIARGVSSPPVAQASTETALLKAIAMRDSDTDGLPDWEEGLYGTDPQVADTFKLGMTDGEAVAKGLIVPKAIANISTATSTAGAIVSTDPSLPPAPAEGTLTAAFAQSFFNLYISALKNSVDGNLSESDLSKIADEAIAQLSQSIVRAPDFKSMRNLTVSGSGPEALKAFAASVDTVFVSNKADAKKSELLYLKDAAENGDATAFPHIVSIAQMYRKTAAGLAVLPVPTELAQDYLVLINSMARIGEITEDFTRVESDPLATILALKQYPQAVQNLTTAFIHVSNIYKTAGVALVAGEPGEPFVNMIANIAAKQKAEKKP